MITASNLFSVHSGYHQNCVFLGIFGMFSIKVTSVTYFLLIKGIDTGIYEHIRKDI